MTPKQVMALRVGHWVKLHGYGKPRPVKVVWINDFIGVLDQEGGTAMVGSEELCVLSLSKQVALELKHA